MQEALGPAAFGRIVEAFHEHVRDALPVAADVERLADGRVRALLPGAEDEVRRHLRALLTRVSSIEDSGPRVPLRVSASVGWAGVLDADYDLGVLTAAAAEASALAQARGGDRWERAAVSAR